MKNVKYCLEGANLQQPSHAQVVETLKAGKPAIFPTDTVYGLGLAVAYASGPQELFSLKGRSESKPVAWLVENQDALETFGQDVPEYVIDLAQTHWPGALTLIVNASDKVPLAFQSHEGTIGLRMPNNAQTLTLIHDLGCPLATTSANLSGELAPKTREDVNSILVSEVGAVLAAEGEAPASGVASTVVDCTGVEPKILRQGSVIL